MANKENNSAQAFDHLKKLEESIEMERSQITSKDIVSKELEDINTNMKEHGYMATESNDEINPKTDPKQLVDDNTKEDNAAASELQNVSVASKLTTFNAGVDASFVKLNPDDTVLNRLPSNLEQPDSDCGHLVIAEDCTENELAIAEDEVKENTTIKPDESCANLSSARISPESRQINALNDISALQGNHPLANGLAILDWYEKNIETMNDDCKLPQVDQQNLDLAHKNTPDITTMHDANVVDISSHQNVPSDKDCGVWDKEFVPSMLQAVSSMDNSATVKEFSNGNEDTDEESSSYEDSSDSDESSEASSSDSSPERESLIMNVKTEPIDDVMPLEPIIPLQSANEKSILLEQDPVVKNLSLTLPSETPLELIGSIYRLIENTVVVVKALEYKVALDLDSVLFVEDRTALGEIYETFGPVTSPYYVICFKDGSSPKDLAVNQPVYFAPEAKEFTKYVFAADLEKYKGSDASWLNDFEPPASKLEYSDDEDERRAKKKPLKRPGADMDGDERRIEPETFDDALRSYTRQRGRGRGTWTNRSVRYANPPVVNMDAAQSGWVNAFGNLSSRKNLPMQHHAPRMMHPPINPMSSMPPPPPPSCFPNPCATTRLQPPNCPPPTSIAMSATGMTDFRSLMLRPPPPPPPPPPGSCSPPMNPSLTSPLPETPGVPVIDVSSLFTKPPSHI